MNFLYCTMSYATSALAARIYSAKHGDKIRILRDANRSNYLLLHHIDKLSVRLQCHQIWYRHLESKHHAIEDSINHLKKLHEDGCFAEGWIPPHEAPDNHGHKDLTDCLGLACDTLDAEIKLFLLRSGATYRI